MNDDPSTASLFQTGGTTFAANGAVDFEGSGVCHIIHRLSIYFKEHNQSELLRVSTEYAYFNRRP
eukprot:11461506-Prorocentrum_lima.AAC.1